MEKKEEKSSLQKSIQKTIEEVTEDICDNYCKYRDTTDEDNLCEITRSGKDCPLDRLT
ncbi:MAG: hypothetical protein IJA32_06635 [Lachnospiraceae bacterium]|nr:hypothetical protein [Lachnospiraceae bacterium]